MNLQNHYWQKTDNINILEELFNSYSVVNRIERLYSIFNPNEILYTSSFGADSAYLLHLVSRICPNQKIYFLDTGYHFEETIKYKNDLQKLLDLNIIDVVPDKKEHLFSEKKELWKIQPDRCCHINKVKPLESINGEFKVWLSGLKKNQSKSRSSIKIFENKDNIIKFHPLYDQTEDSIKKYTEYFNLPQHPLKLEGYSSIGCYPCTSKGVGRDGRWNGTNKTECGLHFDVNL